jgi:tetratricopeptide (TPR) repeat protein
LASLMLGRKESARLDAEAALRVQPDSVPARVAQARVELADGHPERAQRMLDALEHTQRKAHEVALALGTVFMVQKAPDRAKWWFQEALRRDPVDVEARLSLARLYHDLGQFEAARGELKQLLDTNAAYAPARRELALLALDAGDAVAARDELDALVGSDDNVDVETLINAAKAHLLLGDGPGAEDRIARAQKLTSAPEKGEELLDLSARALLVQHKPVEAAALLRKAIPNALRGETVALLMEAHLDMEQPQRAYEAVKQAPLRARTGVELLVARARLQVERGRDTVAEDFAQEAITRMRGPRAPRALKAEAYTILGRSLYEQGTFRAALRALKLATQLDPRMARAWYYLGLVDDDLRRLPEAKMAMESAVKADPLFAEGYYYLGRLRTALGDPTAKEAYQKYLDVDPRGIYAVEVRAALKQEGAPTPTNVPPRIRRRGR